MSKDKTINNNNKKDKLLKTIMKINFTNNNKENNKKNKFIL